MNDYTKKTLCVQLTKNYERFENQVNVIRNLQRELQMATESAEHHLQRNAELVEGLGYKPTDSIVVRVFAGKTFEDAIYEFNPLNEHRRLLNETINR